MSRGGAFGCAAAMFLAAEVQSLALGQYFFRGFRLGLRVRAAIGQVCVRPTTGHSRGTSEAPPRHFRGTSEALPRHLRGTSEVPFGQVVYDKALRMTAEQRACFGVGPIVSYMQIDAAKIADAAPRLHAMPEPRDSSP